MPPHPEVPRTPEKGMSLPAPGCVGLGENGASRHAGRMSDLSSPIRVCPLLPAGQRVAVSDVAGLGAAFGPGHSARTVMPIAPA